MPDRISHYRVVRLALHVPVVDGRQAEWTLVATTVRKGVPGAQIIAEGRVPLHGPIPAVHEIWEALDRIVRQHMLL